jgi:hypothetical protein
LNDNNITYTIFHSLSAPYSKSNEEGQGAFICGAQIIVRASINAGKQRGMEQTEEAACVNTCTSSSTAHGDSESSSKECGICMDEMVWPTFLGKDAAQVEDSTADGHANASRLPCGHAFHATCLVQLLRTSSNCPRCRKGVGEDDESEDEEEEEANAFGSNVWILSTVDDQMTHNPTMHAIRSSDTSVQAARTGLREAVRNYRRLRDRLRHTRRVCLEDALRNFRRRHMPALDAAVVRVQTALARARNCERRAWRRVTSQAPRGEAWENYEALNSIGMLLQNTQSHTDPLHRRFWNLHPR